MLEKVMQQTKKDINHGAAKGAQNPEQSTNNEVTKQSEQIETIKSTSGKTQGDPEPN